MNATEYYRAGQLAQATAAALSEVKDEPADVAKRCFLADLLCFAGELERADRQLDAALQLARTPLATAVLRRQLIRAEQARRQFFTGGRLPEFLDPPSEELRLKLQAAIALREGDLGAARKLLAQADPLCVAVSGLCNQKPFTAFDDLDEFTSSFFEIFTATGKYSWIPFDRVARLELRPPETSQDLLWRGSRIALRQSSAALADGVVYLPVLYDQSCANADEQLKLGLRTDWAGGGDAPYRGIGQRIFAADGVEIPILELKQIEFQPLATEGA